MEGFSWHAGKCRKRMSNGPGASLTPMEKRSLSLEALKEEAEPDPGIVLSTERRSEGQAHCSSVLTPQVLDTGISGIKKVKPRSLSQ